MSDIVLYVGFGVLAASGLAVQLLITYRRHRRDHRKDLEPILLSRNLRSKSAVPKVELGEFAASMMNTGSSPSRIQKVRFMNSGQSSSSNSSIYDGSAGVRRTVRISPRKPGRCWKIRSRNPPADDRQFQCCTIPMLPTGHNSLHKPPAMPVRIEKVLPLPAYEGS